jgi:hypothetical protein
MKEITSNFKQLINLAQEHIAKGTNYSVGEYNE